MILALIFQQNLSVNLSFVGIFPWGIFLGIKNLPAVWLQTLVVRWVKDEYPRNPDSAPWKVPSG